MKRLDDVYAKMLTEITDGSQFDVNGPEKIINPFAEKIDRIELVSHRLAGMVNRSANAYASKQEELDILTSIVDFLDHLAENID